MGKVVNKKGSGVFQTSHTSLYGLKVMERCPSTTQVISVRCEFCVYFGVEIDDTKAPRVRATKTTFMTWKRPFRVDKFQNHHKSQHASSWATYQTCSFDQQAQFFTSVRTPYANTMLAHVNSGPAATPLKFNIQPAIVDVFVGDMFFHPDDQGGTTQKNALKLFKRVDGSGIDSEGDHYEVVLSNRDQFKMVVRNLSRGASFLQCVHIHDDIKEVLGITAKTRQLIERCDSTW